LPSTLLRPLPPLGGSQQQAALAIMAAFVVAVGTALAFSPSPIGRQGVATTQDGRSVISMGLTRRQLGALAAASALPLAASADGANSKATVEKARAIYGSRVVRLASASPEDILEDQNALTLFISGAYRAGPNGNAQDKAISKQLLALKKTAIDGAKAGDASKAQGALKQIVAIAKLTEQDGYDGNYNPKQRRNPGAPPTEAIVAQMGSEAYALYDRYDAQKK